MAKIDLDSLNIDELAALRDAVVAKLLERVTARQVELEAEMERLSQFGGKAGKKVAAAAPAAKGRKSKDKKSEEAAQDGDFPDSVSEAA